MTSAADGSSFQQAIEGEWFGRPSVYAADGTHQGWIKVSRASVHGPQGTTYWMDTAFEVTTAAAARFAGDPWSFSLQDGERDRIYLGPDIYGAGHPYGSYVDAHYYVPGWQADLRTLNHVLADGETQVYSSLVYEGVSLVAVFNGIYKVAHDHATNPETQQRIAEWCEAEKGRGLRAHNPPAKTAGRWTGTLSTFDADQKPRGPVEVVIEHEPTTLLRARQRLTVSGELDLSVAYDRFRDGNRQTYDGPGLWGNASSFGRALFTSQHVHASAQKIRGREFRIGTEASDEHDLCVEWHWYEGDRVAYVTFGVLRWEAAL
jgi:hypothetical protein